MSGCTHVDVDSHGICYACGAYVREYDVGVAIAALMPDLYEAATGRPAWLDADSTHPGVAALAPLVCAMSVPDEDGEVEVSAQQRAEEKMTRGRPALGLQRRLAERRDALRAAGEQFMGGAQDALLTVGYPATPAGQVAAFGEADQIAEVLATWSHLPLTSTEREEIADAIECDGASDRMLGSELRAARNALGLSSTELARLLAARPDQLRKWESGHPKHPIPYDLPTRLRAIAEDRAADVAALLDHLGR